MSGSIRNLATEPSPPGSVDVDVLVIGSGSGGATAARTLAEAGREVLVLEEGGDFTGRQLTQRDGEMYDQLYMDRGGRTTSDLAITVMQGRVLGGGGVINNCDVVPIPPGVKTHWVRRHGLTGFSEEALAPHEARALADLSASRIPEEALNPNNLRLRAGAEALGLAGEVMMHNRVGCAGLGTCLLGCPIDAKRNPRFVAIPAALAAGARFFTRARALRIDGATGERKRVTARRLDERGYREREPFEVTARTVILAANAIASAQLLLRSGLGNAHVGRHLTLQPQLPIVAVFPDEITPFVGIPQAYAITEHEDLAHDEHGWWGYRVEAVSGTPGVVGSLLPWVGAEGMRAMQRYARMGAALLLFPDRPSGTVGLEDDGRPRIDQAIDDELAGRARHAVRTAARAYLEAGAEEVAVPTSPALVMRSEADLAKVDDLPLEPARAPWISAHQQGTVRFAPDEADGAADPAGQVYGTRGVYVFDSSGFPTSASSHTMTPIMTVSEMLTQQLLTTLPALS